MIKRDDKERNLVPILALSTGIGAGAGILLDNITLGAAFGIIGGLITSFFDRIKPKPIKIKIDRFKK